MSGLKRLNANKQIPSKGKFMPEIDPRMTGQQRKTILSWWIFYSLDPRPGSGITYGDRSDD